MGRCVIVSGLLAVVLALYLAGYLTNPALPALPETGWWGTGPPQHSPDTAIRDFKVNIPEPVLEDLNRRLKKARLGEDLENSTFEYGFQVGYMKTVLDHWLNKYDWRKHEMILNRFPQYKTTIEGIEIHFVRVKPSSNGKYF